MSFGGGGSAPAPIQPAAAVPIPKYSDATLDTMAARDRARFGTAGGGRGSTMLTGGLGVPTNQVSTTTSLLGGS